MVNQGGLLCHPMLFKVHVSFLQPIRLFKGLGNGSRQARDDYVGVSDGIRDSALNVTGELRWGQSWDSGFSIGKRQKHWGNGKRGRSSIREQVAN